MKIAITGGSGFIGKKLTETLIAGGHEVIILTRNKKNSSKNNLPYVVWLKEGASPEKKLQNVDALINLAGVSINKGRWNLLHQRQIYESRMIATDEVLRIIRALPQKPSILINASAIGIYPESLDNEYIEKSNEVANDFLGKTVHDWESMAKSAETLGVRTVFMRFGVVLGLEGGALPLMTLPYKLFFGGKVGSGKQWVSWVHVLDAVRSISFTLKNANLSGPVNVTAPHPIRMNEFGKTIGRVLKRPHWFPAPAFILRLALGQKSKLVLEGQKVIPKVLLDEGFEFRYPKLEMALKDLLLKI